MKTFVECYPCFLRQALEALEFIGATDEQQWVAIRRVIASLLEFDRSNTQPEVSDRIHRIIREETGIKDPYADIKRRSTEQALQLYPRLKELVAEAEDPLEVAVRLAIAGNIIDMASPHEFDLDDAIDRALKQPLAVNHMDAFREGLAHTNEVLYLADNAGESVFDRVLIETLDVPVTYVVKGGPSLNDVTFEDAVAAGLDKVATIVSNGLDAMGTILHRCSPEFQQRFADAEFIIAKGQSNYESFDDTDPRMFFLLQAKCPVISRTFDAPVRGLIVKQGGRER